MPTDAERMYRANLLASRSLSNADLLRLSSPTEQANNPIEQHRRPSRRTEGNNPIEQHRRPSRRSRTDEQKQREREKRNNRTEEQRQMDLEKTRARRKNRTEEQKKMDREKMRARRNNRTEEEKQSDREKRMAQRNNRTEKRLEKDRQNNSTYKRQQRGNLSQEEKESRLEQRRQQRSNQPPEVQEVNRQRDAERQQITRRARATGGTPTENIVKIAIRNTQAILSGEKDVIPCGLGNRTQCDHCGAILWSHEKKWSTICCSKGKINLVQWTKTDVLQDDLSESEKAAATIHQMWVENTPESAILRKFSRQLNNALALASQVVEEVRPPNHNTAWTPNVTIRGKLFHKIPYSLLPGEGQVPRFAQIYVFDPNDELAEADIRLGHMSLNNETNTTKEKIKSLVRTLQRLLKKCNPYVQDFIHVCEIQDESFETRDLIVCSDVKKKNDHQGVYHQPTGLKEVHVLLEDSLDAKSHGIIIRKRAPIVGEPPTIISDIHVGFDAFHYVLLFPQGDNSWHVDMPPSILENEETKKKQLSVREFYAYRLHQRTNERSSLFMAGRLFQEYCCGAWARIERQKLLFLSKNQSKLRAEQYSVLQDHMHEGDALNERLRRSRVGRVVLPATYVGSPRYMHSRFQDAMAIVRATGKPDLFITMTMDPNHDDVKRNLLPGQVPADRPDIIVRAFKGLLERLIDDLKAGIFGEVKAYVYSIEYQARGLPHAHILLFLLQRDKFKTADDIDTVVCAELPQDPTLRTLVTRFMRHGPCGATHPAAPCMKDGECSKRYPKQFCPETSWAVHMTKPEYRRRHVDDNHPWFQSIPQPGQGTFVIDNSWIVPYNPYLLKKYKMHINVEMCNTALATKYLFKYVMKGTDRAMARIENTPSQNEEGEAPPPPNEIQAYLDLRSVGATEACWRIFRFPTNDVQPTVQALPVHLENGQRVPFSEGEEQRAALEPPPETQLTKWFQFNASHPTEREQLPLYPDFPQRYVWSPRNKEWTLRKRRETFTTLGRVHQVHPLMGELYYLRMLLHDEHSRGATSFAYLKTIGITPGNNPHASYRDVCLAIGILEDDGEWKLAMSEAALLQLPPSIRRLFCTILEWSNPSDPNSIFNDFRDAMSEDILHTYGNHELFSDAVRYTMLAINIEEHLLSRNINPYDYAFILNITHEERHNVNTIMDDGTFNNNLHNDEDYEEEAALFHLNYNKLAEEQRLFVDDVISSVDNNEGKIFFLDAVAGAGKTFCENLLLTRSRSRQKIAVGVATTGIASTQLKNGKTAQSGLKLPLITGENCIWQLSAQSKEAKELLAAEFILWDEATMAHRHLIEALDSGLRDITGINSPFGGKTIVFAGDFRQTLPIVKHGSRAQIINATIKRSRLWTHEISIYHFLINRRLRINGIDPVAEQYAEWLLTVGNGTAQRARHGEFDDYITIPESIVCYGTLIDLTEWVFPGLHSINDHDVNGILSTAILTTKNETVNYINNMLMDKFPGPNDIIAQSADALCLESLNSGVPIEFLNTLHPAGFPPHRLRLKIGMPLILLRNLNPSIGLSNGTKLKLLQIYDHIIKVVIVGESDKIHFLPRIILKPRDGEYPFEWTRRQFPVNIAFAMTINKSQGQTLTKVGVYLPDSCFAHGQLYTALSRVSHPDNIRVLITPKETALPNQTRNIVYNEIL